MRSSDPKAFTIEDRRVQPIPETGCWIWMGSVRPNGYGQAGFYGTTRLAHRVFYERSGSAIAIGEHLHHLCEQPICCNPAHLKKIGAQEHGHLHTKNGRFHGVAAVNSAKTTCACGAAFVVAYGQRYCRICARRRAAETRTKEGYAEKTRAYQRLWAQKKRAKLRLTPPPQPET